MHEVFLAVAEALANPITTIRNSASGDIWLTNFRVFAHLPLLVYARLFGRIPNTQFPSFVENVEFCVSRLHIK